MKVAIKTPRQLSYKMPAEWEQHERTLLAWPIQSSMCYPENYEMVCKNYYAKLVKEIAEFEPVTVIVNPDDIVDVMEYLDAIDACSNYPVELLSIEHNDAWLRDNGPTFVVRQTISNSENDNLAIIKENQPEGNNAGIMGISWKFNAWGEKYLPYDLDDALAGKILDHYNIEMIESNLVLEGGSIHTDGEGTLLTTEECLLNPNRNPDLSKEQIEAELKEFLNVDKVIWLKNGLYGDETDGHIDNIACFAAPGKVILQVCEDENDPNYLVTQEALEVLENTLDAKGRKLEIIKIQAPPKRMHNGKRLTLSYLNFYFVNGGIILPIFGGSAIETDRKALVTLHELFPDRTIRAIDGMAIIKEGGNAHCTTQQMPRR